MVKASLKGLSVVKRGLKKVSSNISKQIDAEIGASVNRMRAGAFRDAPADEANLRRGINAEKVSELNWVLNSNAAYSVYMEFGTKSRYQPIPGVDPSEFNTSGNKSGKGFYDSILEWVKRKKITGSYSVKTKKRVGSKTEQQIEDEQTAFAIYLSIIRHGVHPHPFFFKQKDPEEPRLVKNIQSVLNDQRI